MLGRIVCLYLYLLYPNLSSRYFKKKYEKVEEFDILNLLCFCLFKVICLRILPWDTSPLNQASRLRGNNHPGKVVWNRQGVRNAPRSWRSALMRVVR